MYPNILLSIFVALLAFMIIGAILNSPRLIKAAAVLIVATVAAALILWLLMGWAPAPRWLTRMVTRLVHAAQGLGRR